MSDLEKFLVVAFARGQYISARESEIYHAFLAGDPVDVDYLTFIDKYYTKAVPNIEKIKEEFNYVVSMGDYALLYSYLTAREIEIIKEELEKNNIS